VDRPVRGGVGPRLEAQVRMEVGPEGADRAPDQGGQERVAGGEEPHLPGR